MHFNSEELFSAATLVHQVVPPTQQFPWPLLAQHAGCEVWIKHENHTPTGAFKVRGGVIYLSALLEIDGDLANGEVSGFEYITTDISYSESGDKLHLSVNADHLFNHANFGEWPNSLEGLILLGVTVEAGLDGLDIAVEVLDQTDPGIIFAPIIN